jgi:hypothetical protein
MFMCLSRLTTWQTNPWCSHIFSFINEEVVSAMVVIPALCLEVPGFESRPENWES